MVNPKILIVEDDKTSALGVKKLLEKWDFQVSGIVGSCDDAIAITKEKNPDCIIMDIVLEGESDGIDAVNCIMHDSDIPIIYLTGNSNFENLARAIQTEPSGYLVKPLNPAELYSAVEIALQKNKSNKKLKESEERYKTLVNCQDELICRFYPDGTLTYINSTYADYFNKKSSELVGIDFYSLIPENEHLRVKENIGRISLNNPIVSHEHEVICSNGTIGMAALD